MPKRIAQYGKLRLRYQHDSANHSLSVALTSVLDPGDNAACQSAADDLAGAVSNLQPDTFTYQGWDSLDPFGEVLNSGGFSTAVVGDHAASGQDWFSNTLTISGKETTPGTDGKYGNTRMEIHVGSAYQPGAGEKSVPRTVDTALDVLCTFLETDTRFWAGFHGNKANVRSAVPQQFNAHSQRKLGA
jgi:hypothetical protein